LTYDRARFKLLECRRKANIHKRIFFHLFRHSSATQNAQLGEPMLRSIYGWSKNSDEPSTYIHLSGETVEQVLLEKAGLNQKAQQELTVIMCPRCGNPNQPNASLCVKCRSILKVQDAVSIDEMRRDIDTLKSMLIDPGQRFRTIEDLESVITSQKHIIEELRKHGLTTGLDSKK
jgi:ribosomal protein L40E